MIRTILSAHQIKDVETNRHLYIGGSDIPYILKTNGQYGKTTIQFAKEKLGIVENSFKGNEHTRYGQLMEPLVRNYINSLGYNFREDSIIDAVKMYRGNCDGLDKKQKLLLEIKTFCGTLKISYYEPQCQFYMELFDIEECLLVGYEKPEDFYIGLGYEIDAEDQWFNLDFDENRVRIYKLKRNREMFADIEKAISKFTYLLDCLREEEILNGATRIKCDITKDI